MKDYKPGDIYIRDFIGETLPLGFIHCLHDYKLEFGNYLLIHWISAYGGELNEPAGNYEVIRLSDGPETIVGVAGGSGFKKDKYLATNFKANLLKEPAVYYDSIEEAIKQLLDFSEKELEAHFNSLQFA